MGPIISAGPERTMTASPPDVRRKRLLFRSWRRGFREIDLVLGPFAERHLAQFEEAELAEYEALLDVPDPELFAWILGREPVPERYKGGVMARLMRLDYLR